MGSFLSRKLKLSPKSKSVAVFLGAALFSLPGSIRLAQRTLELAPLPYEERRARQIGEAYVSMRALEKTLPPGDVNLLLLGPTAIDRAVFVNYYFYPRASHLYFGALPADVPRHPLLVTEAEGPLRRTIVKDPHPSTTEQREWIVPLVAAMQGGDGYASEGIVEATLDTRVTFTLMPDGTTRTYDLRAGTPLIFNDTVLEISGRMATGWLRVQAQQPVRAAFWLVNRARVVAAPIPLIAELPPLPHRLAGGEKLWVLNPGTTPIRARINGREELIEGGALRAFGAQELNEVDAHAPLISFTSTKTRDGNTSFLWPRGIE